MGAVSTLREVARNQRACTSSLLLQGRMFVRTPVAAQGLHQQKEAVAMKLCYLFNCWAASLRHADRCGAPTDARPGAKNRQRGLMG